MTELFSEEENSWVQISALQHYSYCPRQCALIHIEQVFEENLLTMRGRAIHKRADTSGSFCSHAVRSERALPLVCERLGITGKADIVEFDNNEVPYPVEYKHGSRHNKWRHDEIQLTAQALCLEEMTGKAVLWGAIYYYSSRRRKEVEISADLRRDTEQIIADVRQMIEAGKLPPPVSDNRCRRCSLIDICQPELTIAAANIEKNEWDDLFFDTNS